MNISTATPIPAYQFTAPDGNGVNEYRQVKDNPDLDPSRKENPLQKGQGSEVDRSDTAPSKTNRADTKQTTSAAGTRKAMDGHELSAEEQRQIEELRARDREVRAHEQAHIAAGGRYVRSGASYHYQTGPDGKKYAIGGEVSIDTSEEKDPKATIRKMEVVRKAALAPARPSAQDRSVAAQASRKMAEAAAELAKMQAEGEANQAGKAGRPDSATPNARKQAIDASDIPTKDMSQKTPARIKAEARIDIYV